VLDDSEWHRFGPGQQRLRQVVLSVGCTRHPRVTAKGQGSHVLDSTWHDAPWLPRAGICSEGQRRAAVGEAEHGPQT
jgi:hypothetical protein